MEKKVEVQVEGRTVRYMPHMLKDAEKFGATSQKRIIKEVPQELKQLPKELKKPADPLPEMKSTAQINEVLPDKLPDIAEKPKRKPPVRSKAKK